jgi:SAM-dependent methyltransferase
MKLASADLRSRVRRARWLYRERGIKWLTISVLAEIPILPSLFIGLANIIARTNFPSVLTTLAGIHSNQFWPERQAAVQRIAARFLTKRSDVLEIGTWFGRGSTQVWMSKLKSVGGSLTLVDSWGPRFSRTGASLGLSASARMASAHHVAINSVLKDIYKIEADGTPSIRVVRANSNDFLPLLRKASFDLIYIDGSHYYAEAKRDMQEAKRLIRPKGLICGDDLDTLPTPELVALARKNLDLDLLVLPDGSAFHPGVLLAVSEEFAQVESENGFWWVIP